MSAPSRRFRPTTAVDVDRDGHRFEWLKPDGWREGFRALALEIDDPDTDAPCVIGVGRIGPHIVHPGRDLVELEIDEAHRRRGHGTALLHELGRYSNNALCSKVVSGSGRDGFLRSLGAVTYLEVPLLRVDVQADRTARWCEAVRGAQDGIARTAPWSELPREQLVDALTDRYAWQHANWSPTASREVLRPVVGEGAGHPAPHRGGSGAPGRDPERPDRHAARRALSLSAGAAPADRSPPRRRRPRVRSG